jgi:hypothetical protein
LLLIFTSVIAVLPKPTGKYRPGTDSDPGNAGSERRSAGTHTLAIVFRNSGIGDWGSNCLEIGQFVDALGKANAFFRAAKTRVSRTHRPGT